MIVPTVTHNLQQCIGYYRQNSSAHKTMGLVLALFTNQTESLQCSGASCESANATISLDKDIPACRKSVGSRAKFSTHLHELLPYPTYARYV